MKINTNKLIKVSLILIAVGAALLAIGHLLGGRAGVAFSRNGVTSPYAEQKSYTLKKTTIDSFTDTDIRIGSYADIRILPSRDDQFYLEYKLDGEYGEPFWEVRDDTLTLTHTGRQKQFGFAVNFFYLGTFGIQDGIKNAEVNLYIPEGEEMGQLNVYNDSGDFSAEDMAFGDAKLEISYGDAELRDVSFQDLELDMESGDLKAESVTAEDLILKNEYGNVTLKQIKVENTEAGLESGSLKADAFTCNSLTAKVDYGNVELDGFSAEKAEFVLESGNLELDAEELADLSCKNEYGDVEIRLPRDLSEYSVNARSEYGSINLPDGAPGHQISGDGEAAYTLEGKSKGTITVKVESGDIILSAR